MVSILSLALMSPAVGHAAIPRPEHPMPQMVRSEWLNLNGVWEFGETDESDDARFLADNPYPDKIIVPFCRESKLSGLGRRGFVKNVWYRRTFEAPSGWKSPRVLLHVGASDWRTRVWLNGHLLGTHTGASAPFAFDVTKLLKPGSNTAIIHAFDDIQSGTQASGKQSMKEESFGCLYTRTTGIWQTVWLEGVGSSYIKNISVEPDPDNSRALITAEVDGPDDGLTIIATAYAGSKKVGSDKTKASWRNGRLVLPLSEKRLWSTTDPFLYRLKLTLCRGKQVVDRLDSYFGLRSVSIRGRAILINNKPVFQRLVLDQGFYPDGVWTAPSDAELKADIERSLAAGFNGARLHQKVFEPRFLYWADKLGYLVWGEFPNWGWRYAIGGVNFKELPLTANDRYIDLPIVDEWLEVVRRDRNHPSIIGWCPFNELLADAVPLENTVLRMTQAVDPSRPVAQTSGLYHGDLVEVLDFHDYEQDPDKFRERWSHALDNGVTFPLMLGAKPAKPDVPFWLSEYGGTAFAAEQGWGYGGAPKSLDEFYARHKGLTDVLLDNRYMFGFCYTQLTDVEQERNGIYTFDRKPKFDISRIRKVNSRAAAYETNPPIN